MDPIEDPIDALDFSKANGLVTAIAIDDATDEVLMVAFMNPESFRLTLSRGEAVYWSRSRNRLWHKGEESGNTQKVKSLYIDCDGDTVIVRVDQRGGAACHTGRRSCFFRKLQDGNWIDVGEQVFDPKQVYRT
ncbi:MAG: phosphoribosyl-AMP cyclohydrolase [Myxococcota bacterium]